MKINEALKLLGKGQIYYPQLARKIGIEESIFLTYLGYYSNDDDELSRTNYKICNDTALTRSQLTRIQSEFIERGWITKQVKGVERITFYKIHWDKINKDLNGEETSPIINPDNAKTENLTMQKLEIEHYNDRKPANEINNIPAGFEEVIEKWLDYKAKRREKYKNEQQIKIMINRLVKLSGNSPKIANEIIEQSIANNYAGFFPLKGSNYDKRNNKATVGFEPQAAANYNDEDEF